MCFKIFICKYMLLILRNQKQFSGFQKLPSFFISQLFCFCFSRSLFIMYITLSLENTLQELSGVFLLHNWIPPTCHTHVITSLEKSMCSHLLYGNHVEKIPFTIKLKFYISQRMKNTNELIQYDLYLTNSGSWGWLQCPELTATEHLHCHKQSHSFKI